jgi:hypothetical protein
VLEEGEVVLEAGEVVVVVGGVVVVVVADWLTTTPTVCPELFEPFPIVVVVVGGGELALNVIGALICSAFPCVLTSAIAIMQAKLACAMH